MKKNSRGGAGEQLNQEELALSDLLIKPQIDSSDADREIVKGTARELLNSFKAGKPVLNWRRRQLPRTEVQVTVE